VNTNVRERVQMFLAKKTRIRGLTPQLSYRARTARYQKTDMRCRRTHERM
jgi:hypothetical protein